MIGLVVERELKDALQSRKFVLSFAVCASLILLAFVMGAREHLTRVEQNAAALAADLRQMEGLTEWMEVRSHRIFLPPEPLESLVGGVSGDIGRTIEMSGRGGLAAEDSRYEDRPILALFRLLDLQFVFQVVLSLFGIVLGYDAVNGEKERGTLRLVLANALPRHQYILGKLTGAFLALAVPLLVPVLLGCLLLPALGVRLAGEDWLRLGLVVAAGLLSFAVFLALAIFVSALTRRSSSSFLILLVAWVLAVLVVPRAAVLVAGRAVDVPSVDEIAFQNARLRSQLWKEDLDGLGAFKPSQTDNPQDAMTEFNQFMEKRAAEREKQMSALRERLDESRRNRQAVQERLAFGLARISPAACFSLAATALANTSVRLKEQFAAEAAGYQKEYGQFMLEKTGMNLGGHVMFMHVSTEEEEAKEPIDPHELPRFRYEGRPLAASLRDAAADVGILAVDLLVLFLGAVIAFLRYDVR